MKQIKTSGCHECDKPKTSWVSCKSIWIDDEHEGWKSGYADINNYIASETIHPDCPLDDMEEQGGWISVEDRLPEYGYDVLVYTFGDVYAAYLNRSYDDGDIWTGYGAEPVAGVTHWQPQPDKPKEGE
jgi:hypothetical protein